MSLGLTTLSRIRREIHLLGSSLDSAPEQSSLFWHVAALSDHVSGGGQRAERGEGGGGRGRDDVVPDDDVLRSDCSTLTLRG